MSKLKTLLEAYKLKDLKYSVSAFFFVLLAMGLSLNFSGSTPSNALSEKELSKIERQYADLKKKLEQIEKSLTKVDEKNGMIYNHYFTSDPTKNTSESTNNISRDYLSYNDKHAMKFLEEKADILDGRIRKEFRSLEQIMRLTKRSDAKYDHMPAIQPIAKKDMKNVASGFGLRFHSILKIRRMHSGLDFSAKPGAPVYATADGKVKVAASEQGFGNVIRIDHQNGYLTSYAHLQNYKVKVGEKVKRGQVIGHVGSTGLSTGPHLHYEVVKQGKKVDPMGYFYSDLSPDEYKKMIAMGEKMTRSLD